jgi:hypothetical protein
VTRFVRWLASKLKRRDICGDDGSLYLSRYRIFVVGPKTKSWGFRVPGRGFVPWRERLAERGIKADY